MTKPRILIVEDEMITAIDEKETLEELGYDIVSIVDNGEEAIKLAGALKPDVVLMDITLKGDMDGMDAAWQIRETSGIPVIFVTAKGNKGIYDAAHHSNTATGYIIKPFDPEKLKLNIEAALKGELTPPDDWRPLT
ncbi:MAG: response regulator [Alphaproteobacteria bacterium]|nr:response regulator [Alphaproteobacteria bacterium]